MKQFNFSNGSLRSFVRVRTKAITLASAPILIGLGALLQPAISSAQTSNPGFPVPTVCTNGTSVNVNLSNWTKAGAGSWTPLSATTVRADSPTSGAPDPTRFLADTPHMENYCLSFSMKFNTYITTTRWAGAILQIVPKSPVYPDLTGAPWQHAMLRETGVVAFGGRNIANTDWYPKTDLSGIKNIPALSTNTVYLTMVVQGQNVQMWYSATPTATPLQIGNWTTLMRSPTDTIGFVVDGANVDFGGVTIAKLPDANLTCIPADRAINPGDTGLVIAHRGDYNGISSGSSGDTSLTENTISNFADAIAHGADYFETDVQMTSDGVPVIMHNPIGNITSETFQAKKDNQGNPLYPLLTDVLAWMQKTPNAKMLLEFKADQGNNANSLTTGSYKWTTSNVQMIINYIKQYGMQDRVIYQSFNYVLLDMIKSADQSARVMPLYDGSYTSFVNKKYGSNSSYYGYSLSAATTAAEVQTIHNANPKQKVFLWTLDYANWTDPTNWKNATSSGADGIITNFSGPLLNWYAQYNAVKGLKRCDGPTYTVTPSVLTGTSTGTISPSSAITGVPSGTIKSFTVTPISGYTATVGGTCGGLLNGNTYNTKPITGNCTVQASFSPVNSIVTIKAGAGGSIVPAGGVTVSAGTTSNITVTNGSTKAFTVAPNAGYTATVGGTCGGTRSGNTYTTNVITGSCTVEATFTPTTTNPTATLISVTPSTSSTPAVGTAVSVSPNGSAKFTITTPAGYNNASWDGASSACGGISMDANAWPKQLVLTAGPIVGNCTLPVKFLVSPTVTLTSVTPSASSTPAVGAPVVVNLNGSTKFTIATPAGYNNAKWAFNKAACGDVSYNSTAWPKQLVLTAGPVASNCAVSVEFSQ